MARLANEADPARYVRRFVLMPAWFLAGAGVLVLAISVPLAFCEVRAFEVFTAEDYYVSPLLPWETPRFRPWASAVSVEIGCNHYQAKGGPVNRMIYAVTFRDGTVASPAYAPPVGGSWLDGMEIIDATLRSAGVRFVPQAVMSVHAYHPRCIAALRHDFSNDDFRRLQRVLRLPE
ncbi:hypothetical protein SAMN05660859_1521 [Ancylobacter rudongensis]|uniref:Uncharacterized protein n=2 Tax=Ancylobacter rudongensis TaxID=177413 RepID=A0A1G4RBG5_9HYPH|nr:hypothetical protein SAMN05660859_1521 [Ancylobacter rudongensis]